MSEQQYLYIVFSSTPGKMGKFIRTMTHYPYNHVAVSLDKDLKTLYSFARHYRNAPFYGGFVKESRLRYLKNGNFASVKVYALPVTEDKLEAVKNYIKSVEEEADRYVYNMLSAACSPIKKRVCLSYAFTCVEFVVDLLSICEITKDLKTRNFCSIETLDNTLNVYSAECYPITRVINGSSWDGDTYPTNKSLWKRTCLTVKSNGKLLNCFIKCIIPKK